VLCGNIFPHIVAMGWDDSFIIKRVEVHRWLWVWLRQRAR
jgi:hypothetical protein